MTNRLEKLVNEVVSCALGGGIGYWACLDNTTQDWAAIGRCESIEDHAVKVLMSGGNLHFLEEGGRDQWDLNIGKLVEGIVQYLEECESSVDDMDFEIDTEDADCIVQYALFGELVYS